MSNIEFEYDEEKSKKLRKDRGLGFEELITLIEAGNVITTYDHPNQKSYPEQKIFEVSFEGYVWRIPYIQKGTLIRLITGYPCGRATKKRIKSMETKNDHD